LWAEGGAQGGFAFGHAILEDDAANNNGDGGGEVADETKGGGCGGNIFWFDKGLESNERGLEIRADTNAGDELEDDDASPGFVVREVDEEAEAEGHEEHAEPDGREVLSCLFDENADDHGG